MTYLVFSNHVLLQGLEFERRDILTDEQRQQQNQQNNNNVVNNNDPDFFGTDGNASKKNLLHIIARRKVLDTTKNNFCFHHFVTEKWQRNLRHKETIIWRYPTPSFPIMTLVKLVNMVQHLIHLMPILFF